MGGPDDLDWAVSADRADAPQSLPGCVGIVVVTNDRLHGVFPALAATIPAQRWPAIADEPFGERAADPHDLFLSDQKAEPRSVMPVTLARCENYVGG